MEKKLNKWTYWFTSNIPEGKDGPSAKFIRLHGGECKEVKRAHGHAFYYKGVDLDKIPRRAFESHKLYI